MLLTAPLTIRNIAEIHNKISSALAVKDEVVLAVPADADVDISFVQLIISARKSAVTAGKQIYFKNEPQGALRDLLSRGGFTGVDGLDFSSGEARRS